MNEAVKERLKNLVAEGKSYLQAKEILIKEFPREPSILLKEFTEVEDEITSPNPTPTEIFSEDKSPKKFSMSQKVAITMVEILAWCEKNNRDHFFITEIAEAVTGRTRSNLAVLLVDLVKKGFFEREKLAQSLPSGGLPPIKFIITPLVERLLPDIMLVAQGKESPAIALRSSYPGERPERSTSKETQQEIEQELRVLDGSDVEVHFDGRSFSLKAPGISINIENIGGRYDEF